MQEQDELAKAIEEAGRRVRALARGVCDGAAAPRTPLMQRIKALSELLATEERLKKLPRRALAPDADDGE